VTGAGKEGTREVQGGQGKGKRVMQIMGVVLSGFTCQEAPSLATAAGERQQTKPTPLTIP